MGPFVNGRSTRAAAALAVAVVLALNALLVLQALGLRFALRGLASPPRPL